MDDLSAVICTECEKPITRSVHICSGCRTVMHFACGKRHQNKLMCSDCWAMFVTKMVDLNRPKPEPQIMTGPAVSTRYAGFPSIATADADTDSCSDSEEEGNIYDNQHQLIGWAITQKKEEEIVEKCVSCNKLAVSNEHFYCKDCNN